MNAYWTHYRACRKADLGWWRGVGVCWRIRRTGRWQARDAGELRAQLVVIADALKDDGD